MGCVVRVTGSLRPYQFSDARTSRSSMGMIILGADICPAAVSSQLLTLGGLWETYDTDKMDGPSSTKDSIAALTAAPTWNPVIVGILGISLALWGLGAWRVSVRTASDVGPTGMTLVREGVRARRVRWRLRLILGVTCLLAAAVGSFAEASLLMALTPYYIQFTVRLIVALLMAIVAFVVVWSHTRSWPLGVHRARKEGQ